MQIYFITALIFTVKNLSLIWVPILNATVSIPFCVFATFFVMIACEESNMNAQKLFRLLLRFEDTKKDFTYRTVVIILNLINYLTRNMKIFQVEAFIIKIQQHPMKLTLFNHIAFDKMTITFLLAEISMWFFILMQFELESSEDHK